MTILDLLNTDIWYLYIFPRLEFEDLVALYGVHPTLRQIMDNFNFDSVYVRRFPFDRVIPPGRGFKKLLDRMYAQHYLWGRNPSWKRTVKLPQSSMYLGTVEQMVSADVLFESYGEGTISKYHRSSRGWASWSTSRQVTAANLMNFESNGNRSYHVASHENPFFRLNLRGIFQGQCITFLEGAGLVKFDASGFNNRILVEDYAFPEPIKWFCPFAKREFLVLGQSGKLYRVDISDRLFKEIPCEVPLKSAHTFDVRYKMVRKNGKMVCRGTKNQIRAAGALCLGENGRVYYFDPGMDVFPRKAYTWIKDVVKVVATQGAFFTLDRKGRVFFHGSAACVTPGVNVESVKDVVSAEGWKRERGEKHSHPGVFYAMTPLRVRLGVCVDLSVSDGLVGAIIIRPTEEKAAASD